MSDSPKAPDSGLPRASVSIGASVSALEALANSSFPRMPINVRNGNYDDNLLFDVSVNLDPNETELSPAEIERLERAFAWYLENKNSADVRRRVRKARERMKYRDAGGPGG